jgi:hypothetical protein
MNAAAWSRASSASGRRPAKYWNTCGAGDHVEAHIHLLLGGACDQPERVVEQDLCRADLDEQRRQALEVREDRAGQLVRRVRAGQVQVGGLLHVRAAEQRVVVAPRVDARTRQREVGPRREQDRPDGHRQAFRPRRDQRRERQAAAGRVACDDDRLIGQLSVRRQRVVDSGRERVLRREPVLQRHRGHTAPAGQRRGQVRPGPRGADHVATAVQVEDDAGLVGAVDPDVEGRYAADRPLRQRDVVAQRDRREPGVELGPLLLRRPADLALADHAPHIRAFCSAHRPSPNDRFRGI